MPLPGYLEQRYLCRHRAQPAAFPCAEHPIVERLGCESRRHRDRVVLRRHHQFCAGAAARLRPRTEMSALPDETAVRPGSFAGLGTVAGDGATALPGDRADPPNCDETGKITVQLACN